MSVKLDFTDLRILEELKQNARVDAKSLGEKLGVSDRTVARRMKLMEDTGIVKRYMAVVDYEVLRRATDVASLSPAEKTELAPITIGIIELRGMMTALKKTFGTGMGLIVQYMGLGIGRGLAATLPADMEPVARCIVGMQKLNSEGWGIFTAKLGSSSNVSSIILTEGRFLEVAKDSEEQLAFHILVKGIVTGFLEELFGTAHLNEVACVLEGESRCEFKVA